MFADDMKVTPGKHVCDNSVSVGARPPAGWHAVEPIVLLQVSLIVDSHTRSACGKMQSVLWR